MRSSLFTGGKISLFRGGAARLHEGGAVDTKEMELGKRREDQLIQMS